MTTINPYFSFLGNTEEVFLFYKSVFGGEFAGLQRFKDIPGGENMSADEQEKIMHITYEIAPGYVIMGTDSLESAGHTVNIGNHISLSIGTDSKEEAERLFNGLSAGGEIEMPLQDTFWNAYFGAFTDKFGVKWMVNYDYPQK